jgi:hypothetical protein
MTSLGGCRIMADNDKDKGKGKKGNKDGKSGEGQDSVDKLTLANMPLTSQSLKSSRLIKNTRLETMLELHNDPVSGSLQIRPEEIPATFPGASKDDQALIEKLAALDSYDVYSLRINLKKLGIEVAESTLSLSEGMQQKLERYSLEFTRPLIIKIFGDGKEESENTRDFHAFFRNPDVALVQERLKNLSQKTSIPLPEIPDFLLNYRDLFLSTLYYRENLESLVPELNRFWLWIADLKNQKEVSSSPGSMARCRKVMGMMRFLFISTRERLTQFRGAFDVFWDDMNPGSFAKLRRQIEDNHTSMGAVLCALGVKMRDWSQVFPDNRSASVAQRIQYIMAELEPGLDKLMGMENRAREQIGMKAAGGNAAEEEAALCVLTILLGNQFKCLSGDVWKFATFQAAWIKDNDAKDLDLKQGIAHAIRQGWIAMVKEGVSYRLTEEGFDKGITLSSRV